MPFDQAAAMVLYKSVKLQGKQIFQVDVRIHHNIYFLRYLRFSNGLPTATAAGHLSFGSRRGAIFECYATTVLARFRYDSRAQDPKRKEIIITINKQIKSKRENVINIYIYYNIRMIYNMADLRQRYLSCRLQQFTMSI